MKTKPRTKAPKAPKLSKPRKHKAPKLTGENLRKQLARAASLSIMGLPKNTLLNVVKESDGETRGRVAFRIMLAGDAPTIQVQASFEQRIINAVKPIKL